MRNLDILRPLSAAAILICLSANAPHAGDFVPADLGTASVESAGQASSQPSLDVPRQMIAFRQTATAMRLEGEDAARELTFYLSADQVTTAGILRLSYTNAVSVMPDDAMLDVELNGKPLAAFPIRSPNGPATHDIPVAAKHLTVGWNQVRLRAKQHHRIDCSVHKVIEVLVGKGFATPLADLTDPAIVTAKHQKHRGVVDPGHIRDKRGDSFNFFAVCHLDDIGLLQVRLGRCG